MRPICLALILFLLSLLYYLLPRRRPLAMPG